MKRLGKFSIRVLCIGMALAIHAIASESPYAIPDDAAFFSLLDLQRPDLAEVRKAVEMRN